LDCYTPCICYGDDFSAQIERDIVAAEENINQQGGHQCNLKCGGARARKPSCQCGQNRCQVGEFCSSTSSQCSSSTTSTGNANGAATTTTIVIKHIIELDNISPTTFNNDKNIIQAFTDTAVGLLNVRQDQIQNVRACSDATEKSCPPIKNKSVRRRSLLAGDKCFVHYDVNVGSETEAKAVVKSIKSSKYQNSKTFTNEFKQAMQNNDVDASISSSIVATPSAETTEITKNDGMVNKENSDQDQDDRGPGNSGGDDFLVMGAFIGVFIVVGVLIGGFMYYKKQTTTGNDGNEGTPHEVEMASVQKTPVQQTEWHLYEIDENNQITQEVQKVQKVEWHQYKIDEGNQILQKIGMPPLHSILKNVYLTSWLPKFVAYGIHTTDILMSEIDEEDMKAIGMRTNQRKRLLDRMNELKGMNRNNNVPRNTCQETKNQTNVEPTKKNWKRRFSVASNLEFFENVKTGKVQYSPPTEFGGKDDENTIATEANASTSTLKDQLLDANLSFLYDAIETDFQGDVSLITKNWMKEHCGKSFFWLGLLSSFSSLTVGGLILLLLHGRNAHSQYDLIVGVLLTHTTCIHFINVSLILFFF